ncbi:HNH endonuclease signature motif containing protein [Arthrobacter mobilis]|uniref:HNH endonuclease n=1 Tax=Arthrobacter mobilis TaxID=2724944 RepID=A0A7X6HGS8_9MICC|nr:HNH endonuclease signature motif containing protein [Arthrobacter mobilis]NKX55949.1 HNH endonuclease [Arthrobacter mobilis]
MVNYWWASQGRNYPEAIEARTLFTNPRHDRATEESRTMIKDLRPGDIVFHHHEGHLRAVSRVTEPWKASPRPPESPKWYPDEPDEGWLVEIEPIRKGVDLHFTEVAKLIRNGPDRPFHSGGAPARGRFLSALSEDEGLALLAAVGLSSPAAVEEGIYGRPDEWGGGDTDDVSLAAVRREQADLRRHLLSGRSTAPCAICGEERPARLLVAGHIKPRSECTEEERKDFRSVAMLVCSLGCDALFGWGYIVVDADGRVSRGIPAETKDVEAAVDLLIGKTCGAHNEHTDAHFATHAELSLASI